MLKIRKIPCIDPFSIRVPEQDYFFDKIGFLSLFKLDDTLPSCKKYENSSWVQIPNIGEWLKNEDHLISFPHFQKLSYIFIS